MIQWRIKLKPNATQERQLKEWFNICTGIWNWAIRKIELDGKDGFWYSQTQFNNILAGHPQKLEIPNCMMQGMLTRAWRTWKECFKKNKGVHPAKWSRPRLKGFKSPLTSLPLPHPGDTRLLDRNHVRLAKLGAVKFCPLAIPEGKIKCSAILREPSGYYLCLFIDVPAQKIDCLPGEMVGIDPGFKDLLNLSTGEKVNNPPEIQAAIERTEARLIQANRGKDYKLVRRLNERLRNLKKQRNHVISKDLVRRFEVIAVAKDNESAMAKTRRVQNKSGQKVKRKGFGASVTAATHYQLRQMIQYKALANGREYHEVDGKYSTRQCSRCLEMTGPKGIENLGVREWVCSSCGAEHDRDTNAALNVLMKALGANTNDKEAPCNSHP